MKQYLKQFMGWVTDLTHRLKKNNLFEFAHLRLTLQYTTITMIIVMFFSIALFVSLEKNIQDVSDGDIEIPHPKQYQMFKNNIKDIESDIFLVDFMLLFIVSSLGYVIAGKTLKPIKDNMETQKRFLADASHDLRTPLAIMKSESQVLIQSDSKNIKDYTKILESNVEEINKMSNLVDDLLMIARTEGVSDKNTFEIVDLQKLLENTTEKMKKEAEKKNISLTVDTIPASVKGQVYGLERVFQNIIKNAINHTPALGQITCTLKKNKNQIIISIVDTGVGIREKDLPYVFDRFFKAEHSRNDASGSGLGLPIAKQIIEQYSGKIAISSVFGKGTEVTLAIPKA